MTDVTVEANFIHIADKIYKTTRGSVQFQDIATFAPKSTIGDTSRDSNPLLSSWVITDLSGGHGVHYLEEGADAGRYRFGVIDARRPRQITCPPETLAYVGADLSMGTGAAVPLGKLGETFYVSFGGDIAAWDEATLAFTDTADDITGTITNKPTAWSRGGATTYLYIPLGDDGYATYDGTTLTPVAAPDAVDFLVWDQRLICIDDDGQLHQTLDGTTWESLEAEAKLDVSITPRQLVKYFDRNDTYVPYLTTDQATHAIDMSGPTIYETELYWPQHDDMGLGSANWRGDLHVAVGMGVFRYNGSVITAIGLDRDQGLPAQYRGKITDLVAAYNEIYALVSGQENEEEGEELWVFDGADDDWYINPATTVSSLHEFTGMGWHCLWTTTEPMGAPTWGVIAMSDETYRLWWGVGNAILTMRRPKDFANARAAIESGEYRFATYGWLESGIFDAAMQEYLKLGEADMVQATIPAGCRIDVSYRTSPSSGYTFLLSMTETDGDSITQGLGPLIANMTATEGEAFSEIELKFELYGTGATAPILESNVLTFEKLNKSALSITANIDLSARTNGRSPITMLRELMTLKRTPKFIPVTVGGEVFRMRISSISGGQYTGSGEERAEAIVSLLEVPVGLSEGV